MQSIKITELDIEEDDQLWRSLEHRILWRCSFKVLNCECCAMQDWCDVVQLEMFVRAILEHTKVDLARRNFKITTDELDISNVNFEYVTFYPIQEEKI
jgi:hypothetical protein